MNSTAELDSMADMPNDLDDLGNLFEFGDINLDNIPDPGQFAEHMQQQQHGTHPNTPFQDMSEPPHLPGTAAHDFGGHDQFAISQSMDQHFNSVPTTNPYVTESRFHAAIKHPYPIQQQNFQYSMQPGYPPNHHIPPTPNSYELHGVHQHPQLDAQQRAILDQRYQLRKDDAIAFTPMVSPAGTPQYNMVPEFTTPGAYFSPLTSPMLHAQNQQQQMQFQQQQQQGYLTNPSTAPSSNTNSPVDMNIDVQMLDGTALPEPATTQVRKSRRKIATPRTVGAGGRAKQSPAHHPQKRKSAPLSSSLPHTSADSLGPRSITSQPKSAGLQMPPQFDSSEAESISPEPLNESVMGPPPRPGWSLTQSPALNGQTQKSQNLGTAATPKSLLTMRGGHPQPVNGQQQTLPQTSASNLNDSIGGLDDLSLPEAATKRSTRKPSLTSINTSIAGPSATDENNTTPRLSSRKTPKLGPLSTPASARPGSALASPNIVGSPMAASTPSAILKDGKDGRSSKGGNGSKKRGSMSASSSKLVSPALVPKISPSIKPLLPEGTPLHTATQAMLLASKSNYQNLLEGNHLPGVNYPDSLSTGLTSKRTSHKVAEQGRRNRINEALKEMQNLVPKPALTPKSAGANKDSAIDAAGDIDGSPPSGAGAADDEHGREANGKDSAAAKEDANAKSNSSKAATVELANEYIRRMQKESVMQGAEVLRLRRENEELRRRLIEQHGGSEVAVSSPEVDASPSEIRTG